MPALHAGDVFTTSNPMWLGRAICYMERFVDVDNAATYSHAGIITDYKGTTFEALWKNGKQDIFKAYAGKRVLIGRHAKMNLEAFQRGWDGVKHLEGRWYAGHRLLLHLVPPVAKMFNSGKFAVCSEIVAKFLKDAGFIDYWAGVNPDYIADMIKRWRDWTIVYEGILPATYEELAKLVVENESLETKEARV
jgi:hypothetical protein